MASASSLDNFSERTSIRNLGLEVQNQIFWVPRDKFAEFSPVFTTMCYGPFQESNKEIVPLPEKSAAEILEMLRCLFSTKKIDTKNVGTLLKFADEYLIEVLTKKCRQFFESQSVPVFLKLASEHKLDYLTRKCEELLQQQIRMENVEIVLKLASDRRMEDVIRKCEHFFKEEMASAGFSRRGQGIVKMFTLGVQYKMKNIVRDLFPDVRRYNLSQLEPFFDKMPLEIGNAIRMPMPLATEKEHTMKGADEWYYKNDECDRCRCINFDKKTRNKVGLRCESCYLGICFPHFLPNKIGFCRFGGCGACSNRNPRNGVKEEYCQCMGAKAIGELEKVGF